MIAYAKNSTLAIPFLMVSSADHLAPATGLTPTVYISKNGGAFAPPAGSVYEFGYGWYALLPTTADTNAIGSLVLHATGTGADPSDTMFQITGVDLANPTTMGVANLDAAVSTRATPGAAMTLTAPYDAAKNASSQASVDAIAAKTANIPVDPADASDIAASFAVTNGKVDTVAGYVDTEVGAIKAKTDQMTFTGGKIDANVVAAAISPADLTAIADAILKRDWTALTGEAAYSLLNAARMLRNVWNTTGGTLTVHREDGTTVAWSRVLATDPNADPITGVT
jgi:hypothetical protein